MVTLIRGALAAALLAGATLAQPAEPVRGRALYESKCTGCHAESVHGRGKRAATDFAGVRAWVERWNATLRLRWSAEEIDDVAAWLNATYYRYPCPPATCTAVSRLDLRIR